MSESSSSTNAARSDQPAELLGPVKESVAELGGLELRTPDPVAGETPLKDVQIASDSDTPLPEKSAELGAQGLLLAPPQPLDETLVDVEKSKTLVNGAGTSARGKKRPGKLPKSNPKMAWGTLLSQCSKVDFSSGTEL